MKTILATTPCLLERLIQRGARGVANTQLDMLARQLLEEVRITGPKMVLMHPRESYALVYRENNGQIIKQQDCV